MRLDERQEHILDFIVRDFIETASPVSSSRVSGNLHKKQTFAGSPATIRNIMLELDGAGFLYQPHTSAGRAPTEKGYRYFVENLISDSSSSSENSLTMPPLRGGARQHLEFSSAELESLVNNFAHELGIFTSAMTMGRDGIREIAGFQDILSEPEFREEEMLQNFGRMVDEIEDVMTEYHDALIDDDDNYDIWIGRENIYPGAKKGSAIVARASLPKEGELTFFAFGPTRMNYEKAIIKIKKLVKTYG